jgi:hypothetical protein
MTPAERRTRAKPWRRWFPDFDLAEWHGTRALGAFEVAMFVTEGGSWVVLAVTWPTVEDSAGAHNGVPFGRMRRPNFDAEPEAFEVVLVSSSRRAAEDAREHRFCMRLASYAPASVEGARGFVESAPEPEQLPLLGLDNDEPRRR